MKVPAGICCSTPKQKGQSFVWLSTTWAYLLKWSNIDFLLLSRGLKSISQSRNDRPVASVTRSYPTFRCFLYHCLDAKGEYKLTLSCLHISSNFASIPALAGVKISWGLEQHHLQSNILAHQLQTSKCHAFHYIHCGDSICSPARLGSDYHSLEY